MNKELNNQVSLYTVISSYTSRNDNSEFYTEEIISLNPELALHKYLVDTEGYEIKQAKDFINKMGYKVIRKGIIEWFTDDPFYIVFKGKVNNQQIRKLLK